MNIPQGEHEIKIEGIVVEEDADAGVFNKVMEWRTNVKTGNLKSKVKFQLNAKYKFESITG